MASLAWYGLATLLVVVYVQTFSIWNFLARHLGDAAGVVPWALAALMALVAILAGRRRMRDGRVAWLTLAAAAAVVLLGLLIADPQYPAKRVHVPQYALLAIVVWAALRGRVAADRLAVGVIVVVGLFGVHDEFMQGLHPERSFGVRDMLVNLAGGVAGTLALAGLSGRRPFPAAAFTLPRSVAAGLAMSLVGLVLYVPALAAFREQALPYWGMMPLLAGTFAMACALSRDAGDAGLDHLGSVVVIQLVLLSVYPVVANETPLVFT